MTAGKLAWYGLITAIVSFVSMVLEILLIRHGFDPGPTAMWVWAISSSIDLHR